MRGLYGIRTHLNSCCKRMPNLYRAKRPSGEIHRRYSIVSANVVNHSLRHFVNIVVNITIEAKLGPCPVGLLKLLANILAHARQSVRVQDSCVPCTPVSRSTLRLFVLRAELPWLVCLRSGHTRSLACPEHLSSCHDAGITTLPPLLGQHWNPAGVGLPSSILIGDTSDDGPKGNQSQNHRNNEKKHCCCLGDCPTTRAH